MATFHRHSSASHASDSGSKPMSPSSPRSVDIPSLQEANRLLHDRFNAESNVIPDLVEMMSDRNDHSSPYAIFSECDYKVPFQKRKLVGIPDALFQYYTSTNVTSHMGIIPEIERVWVSIDTKLFLWDYVGSQEISFLVDPQDVVTQVALVKPKCDVFIDEISHILVICTPTSVLLLGLSYNDALSATNRIGQNIKVYATDMSISTDIEMTSIVGTADGRILMCGSQDGCLYELYYQKNESWFSKRLRLINHSASGVQSLFPNFSMVHSDDRIISVVSDSSRFYFYTLTASQSIHIYRLINDKGIQHVQTLENLCQTTQAKLRDSSIMIRENFQISSLHVVQPCGAHSGLQLMAITTNGIRLFFSSSRGTNYAPGPEVAGSLQLFHARLPPHFPHPTSHSNGGTRSHEVIYPNISRTFSGIDVIYYSEGLTVAAQPGHNDGVDDLLCIAPDLAYLGSLGQSPRVRRLPYQTGEHGPPSVLKEHAMLLTIPGRTWAIASSPNHLPDPSLIPLNELAIQFSRPQQELIVLTNVGLTFLAKRRALDYLRAAIEEVQAEGNLRPLVDFRDSFGRDQTCAMLLGLASGNVFIDAVHSPSSAKPEGSLNLVTTAKQAFWDLGDRPILAEKVTYAPDDSTPSVIFSGRREGLIIYFSRLVRPIWTNKLFKQSEAGLTLLNIQQNILAQTHQNLTALQEFLDKNSHVFHSCYSGQGVADDEKEGWKVEVSSISQIRSLLARTIEGISFVLLVDDHRIGDLVSKCDTSVQVLALSTTLESLITTADGVTVSRALVDVIIERQIALQINIDIVGEVVQGRCGSFYSPDDIVIHKAHESIRRASVCEDSVNRERLLAESLQLLMQGTRVPEMGMIHDICNRYRHLNYAEGAVIFPLACAQRLDAKNTGLQYWLAGCPSNDSRSDCYYHRQRCYKLVLEFMANIDDPRTQMERPVGQSVEDVRALTYNLALASEDEVFHSAIYEWLEERGLADELLEMRPRFLEAYLKREPVSERKHQLLWQFYVKDSRPLRAAEVLGGLAYSDNFDFCLDRRMEYLTLAVGIAKSHSISHGKQYETAVTFLTDLEDKLDIAQVQLEIYKTIHSCHENDKTTDTMKVLSRSLLDISELFRLCTDPVDLPVMKLLILHVSGHRDDDMLCHIWTKIFQEALDASVDAQANADRVLAAIVPLARRFYPSESSFPSRHVATLVIQFHILHHRELTFGWAGRAISQCSIPYSVGWNMLHDIFESGIPASQSEMKSDVILADIAVLLLDWFDDTRNHSYKADNGFPAGLIDLAIDQYVMKLTLPRSQVKEMFDKIKFQLRRNW